MSNSLTFQFYMTSLWDAEKCILMRSRVIVYWWPARRGYEMDSDLSLFSTVSGFLNNSFSGDTFSTVNRVLLRWAWMREDSPRKLKGCSCFFLYWCFVCLFPKFGNALDRYYFVFMTLLYHFLFFYIYYKLYTVISWLPSKLNSISIFTWFVYNNPCNHHCSSNDFLFIDSLGFNIYPTPEPMVQAVFLALFWGPQEACNCCVRSCTQQLPFVKTWRWRRRRMSPCHHGLRGFDDSKVFFRGEGVWI